ncbi:MAG: serine/threonine protein kinase [Lachnospiraceae bacterium]|nr:serine/threonine protein kinase [Lachnospiraceae bacterium]
MQYEVIAIIKKSDKGSVYLAKVEEYDFPVIVKQLKRGNRKVYEALQALKNEYIPQIYHLEENEDGLLVAEEYIEGELLSEYLTEHVLTETQYISIARQLCDGLEKLHSCNPPVIHRDIKPSNIIVNSKGSVKIIDFDSSRQYKEESESDTRLLGTEKYAAPEQYGFSQTDCRSDIYSLGIVFGSFPDFASEKKNRLWKRLVERCTLFAPESRYQSMAEVQREIQKIEKTDAFGRRKMAEVAGILILVCALLVLVLGGKSDSGRKPEIQPTPVPAPTLSPTPILSPTPFLTPTPKPTPTRRPTVTPFKMWKPSPTPTPTPIPTITPTPTPLPGPTPTLLPLELGEQVVNTTRADVVG